MLNENLSAHALNEQVMCAGTRLQTGLCQLIRPYTRQIANVFSIELRQWGSTVVK